MLKRILIVIFALLAIPQIANSQGDRPGFKNGIVTIGRNVDSLYIMPPVDGTNGQVPITDGAGTVTWGAGGGGADTTVLKYLDLTLSTGEVDLKRGIKGAWAKAGENLVFGDIVYFALDSTWMKADADTVSGSGNFFSKRGMGFVTETINSGATGTIMTEGVAALSTWNFPFVGGDIYLSTTAGAITQTPDTTAGNAIQIIGWAPHPDLAIFKFDQPWSSK